MAVLKLLGEQLCPEYEGSDFFRHEGVAGCFNIMLKLKSQFSNGVTLLHFIPEIFPAVSLDNKTQPQPEQPKPALLCL